MNIIKYLFALLVILSCGKAYGQNDPVLMKVNGEAITKSDFEYAYKKANNPDSSGIQTIDQFLQSFIDSKLKIEEAKSKQLDKDQVFNKEYSTYLDQIEKEYTTDSISPETVAKKVYDRLGENIQISRLFITYPTTHVLPKDTLEAYKKIASIRKSAINGDKNKFEELVLQFSNDTISKRSSMPGYIGWKTALMLDPQVEDAMYETALDSISQPIRTNAGYYLIKVFDRRPDLGQINLSHIFFPYPYEKSTTAQKDSVRNQAQKVYEALTVDGVDFARTAELLSSDLQSAPKGGALGWFGVSNPLPTVFEEPLFTLEKGEVSHPLEMDYGFHIFKVVDKRYQLPWQYMKEPLISAISDNDRNESVKKLEIERLTPDFPYNINTSAYNQLETIARTYHIADSIYFQKIIPLDNLVLLTVGGKEYKVADFVDFLVQDPGTNFTLSTDILSHKVNDFILQKQQDARRATLKEKYPEFRHLTQEYYDGILLFDVMNQEIWSKAQNDTKNLEKLFNENPSTYKWESPKYKGYVIHAKDKATLKKVKNLISQHPNQNNLGQFLVQQLNTDSVKNIEVEKGLWGKGENGFVDRAVFKTKNNKEIIGYPEFMIEGKLINAPENMEDARGQVVADYQAILEKEWVESLRKKYKVEINEDILNSLK